MGGSFGKSWQGVDRRVNGLLDRRSVGGGEFHRHGDRRVYLHPLRARRRINGRPHFQRFLPDVLRDESGLQKLGDLVRTYFRLDGHHVQFNVVDSETLRRAQEAPIEHRDLVVRVAGYSDYFNNLDRALQEEIIARTAHEEV